MRDFSRADEKHYSVWGRVCMKIQNAGYIKLHRKFLMSHVHKLNGSAVCLFIDLLLLADKEGKVETSYTDLQTVVNIRCHKAIKVALEQLQQAGAIKFVSKPNLIIELENWGSYQARAKYGENTHTNYGEITHSAMGKIPIVHGENTHTQNETIKVPVQLNKKEYKNFKNSKNNKEKIFNLLNFQNPQTDLEKLIRFYLEGTCHPALKKPNANDLLNVAMAQDIPHFKTILANCDDLEQAKACVKKYVSEAKGTYSMFYLAGQINSIRQEVESRENRQR